MHPQQNPSLHNKQRLAWLLCLVSGLAAIYASLYAPLALALPGDKEQPIHIKSNTAEVDDSKGISIYSGAVVIDQGTINLKADMVTIYRNEAGVERLIATGNPAHFRQQPEIDKPLLHAYGDTIEYHLSDEQITIRENAGLEQEDNTVKGDRIDYDISKRKVNAYSGDTKKSSEEAPRIELVIQPKTLDKSKDNKASDE